jgi:hypothetical protein
MHARLKQSGDANARTLLWLRKWRDVGHAAHALIALLLTWCGASMANAQVASVPAWVQAVDAPKPNQAPAEETEWLLLDEQLRVDVSSTDLYRHIAYVVHTTAGVQSDGEISVGRASDATITWHYVRRVRDGATTDLLTTLKLKTIQPEAGLGEGIYDGSRREVFFLEDLRVGDRIEYAYTLRESNAVLDMRHSSRHFLGRGYPIRRVAFHASWPAQRPVAVRAHGTSIERLGDGSIRVMREDVPGYESAAHEPAWFEATPWLELSEFSSWADVVAWALARYQFARSSELGAMAAAFVGDTLEERAAQAVRFVQDEVRYLGIEEGVRALEPHPPNEVLARRFGDCKDKAVLLVALLRELGVRAEPALVNTRWERGVADALPSPVAFDHVVVQLELDGHEIYVDATASFERGPLREAPSLRYGRALLLRAGEAELRELPVRMPREPTIDVRERFTLSGAGSATLHVFTTYRGSDANSLRRRVAHSKREDLQQRYLDFYRKEYGELSVRAPLEVMDDPARNQIVVSEHYTIREFWQEDEQTVRAWSLVEHLLLPDAERAARPFATPHPVYTRHLIELYATNGWRTSPEEEVVDSEAFHYSFRSRQEGRTELIEHQLLSKADHIPPTRLNAYERDAKSALDRLYSSYVTGEKVEVSGEEVWGVLACLAVLGLIWALVVAVRRLVRGARKRRFRRSRRFVSGEAAEVAIPISRAEDAHAILARITCCGEPLFVGAPVSTALRYADRELSVYRNACGKCRRSHVRYFADQP